MAFAPFTGKSGGTIIKFNGVTLLGWRKISIAEDGRPLPAMLDITDAGDAAYTFVADPLGGKGSRSATVTVEGLLSEQDHQDGATGWLQFSKGDTYSLVITTKSGGDEWTETCTLKSFVVGAEVATLIPYTATFTCSNGSGTWATDVP